MSGILWDFLAKPERHALASLSTDRGPAFPRMRESNCLAVSPWWSAVSTQARRADGVCRRFTGRVPGGSRLVTPPCAASLAGATDMRRGAAAGSVGVAACGIEKTAAARQPVSQCRDSACQTARSRGNHFTLYAALHVQGAPEAEDSASHQQTTALR